MGGGNDRATRFIRYGEDRALEDAAFGQGLTPTRLVAFLLPVWSVEIEATILDGKDYRVLDRYVERGIAEGGFGTAADLARFFGVEQVVVDRAIRSLKLIDHIAESAGRLMLTELGLRSVREGRRYIRTDGDRRKLYFDGHSSQPLTHPYYESEVVKMWPVAEAATKCTSGEWPRFTMLFPRGFRTEAVTELIRRPQRDLYNLPDKITNPRVVGAETVYLPAYVVRATDTRGHVRHLAYSRAGKTADPHLSAIVEQNESVTKTIDAREQDGRSGDEGRIRRWLEKEGLGDHPAVCHNGAWSVTLPATAFGGSTRRPVSKVGSYQMLADTFVRVWCPDEDMRRRALRARVGSYLDGWKGRPDPAMVDELVRRIARQLQLGAVDSRAVQAMATKAGNRTLATQLARVVQADAGS